MATALRLLRTGTTKRPCYRLVVIDQARANKGAVIENLGVVPVLKEADAPSLHAERVKHWLGVGSIVSESARTVLKRAGLYTPPTASRSKKRPAAAKKP